MAVQTALLQPAPNGLGGRAASAVALAAHRAFHLVALESRLELVPAVLAASVGCDTSPGSGARLNQAMRSGSVVRAPPATVDQCARFTH